MTPAKRGAIAANTDKVLRRLCFDGNGANRFTPVYERTPLDELLEEETPLEEGAVEHPPEFWPSDDAVNRIELRVLKMEEAAAVAEWARLRLMQWIFGDGPKPLAVGERAFLMAFARYKDLIGPMDGADIGELFGKGRSAISAKNKRLFRKPVIARLGHAMIIPGQKSELSRALYAANAAENTPRRNLPTDKEIARKEREEEIATTKELRAKLKKEQAPFVRKKTKGGFEGFSKKDVEEAEKWAAEMQRKAAEAAA